MIRINTGADLDDMFGGQTDFEVSVTLTDEGGLWDIIGAGHTVSEAVAEARETMRGWRENSAEGVPNASAPYDEDEWDYGREDFDRNACPGCGGGCQTACH